MPRRTPVKELQADEENLTASPLRRSSRLASPGPSKVLQRRNSASEDSPAKLTKVKRLSLSMKRENDEPKEEEKSKDSPRKSTRVTRSSSMSPSSLLGDTEIKPPSNRTHLRAGSVSKTEEEINPENVEDVGHKTSQSEKSKTTLSKPRTRRSSLKDKIVSLEVIEESPKAGPRAKATLTKKESLNSIAENSNKETGDTPPKVKNISAKVEMRKTVVEKNGDKIAADVGTKSPIQSPDVKVISEKVAANGTEESTSIDGATQKKTETDSCKISPVVILNSIEKQMNDTEEKISLKKSEITPKKDEAKPGRNKSPIVVLQSIEKIISKQNHEKNIEHVEPNKNIKSEMIQNIGITSVKEKVKDNGVEQSLDQEVLPDELCKNDKSVAVACKQNIEANAELLQSRNVKESKTQNKEDITKEKLEDNTDEDQSSAQKVLTDELCKINEIENDSTKQQKQIEIKEAIATNDNQCSEVSTSAQENTKESLGSLLLNQFNVTEGSEGSSNVSLPDVPNNTQEDITSQSKADISIENKTECVGIILNTSENSDKENSLKDKPQIGTESEGTNESEVDVIEPKQNLSVTKENVFASTQNEKTEYSFCEPMEIEYTDFNCTVNSSVMETEDEESSLVHETSVNKVDADVLNKNEGQTIPVDTGTINKQNESSIGDTNKADQNQSQEDSFVSKEINEVVTEKVNEVMDESKSKLDENEIPDVTQESEVHDKSIEQPVNETNAVSLEHEQSSDQPEDQISSDARKSISFAFNLDDEQFMSDEDVPNKCSENDKKLDDEQSLNDEEVTEKCLEKKNDMKLDGEQSLNDEDVINKCPEKENDKKLDDEDVINKSQEEKCDNEKSNLNTSKLEESNDSFKNSDHDTLLQNENDSENQEINAVKSPSPVFSVDENQCLSDDETSKIDDDKVKEQSFKKQDENVEINNEKKLNEENKETEVPRSPSPTFSIDDSQSEGKIKNLKDGNEQEKEGNETVTKKLDASNNSQTTIENIESDKEKAHSDHPNVDDQVKGDFELKKNEALTGINEEQSLEVTCEEPENIDVMKSTKSADDKKLSEELGYWKSKNKKLSKKKRKSIIEDDLTSTVRALFENVDDLDAKVDALIEKEKETSSLNQGENDDELSQDSFIDDMAEEGEEDTPSEGSNDILIEGESLDSVDTTSGSDGSYGQDSFIDDEEVNSLLSGEEDFLEERKPSAKTGRAKKIKRRRIISDSESYEDQPSEHKESLQVKTVSCDSDDRMSTDPYLGLTPPSHVSVQESSSDIDIRSFNNENEIIINDDDNLKSLEAMRDVTNANSKQADVATASSIICLDSDEEAVLQKMFEPPSDISKTEKVQNEEETTNVASTDLSSPTKSPKSRSSLNIQESIKLQDVEDGMLTNKICGIVDFFYSNIKQNNSVSGTVSLNVSLDFADTCAEDSNVENIKIQSLKKRSSESVESLPEKKMPKRMKLTLSPQNSVLNEDGMVMPDIVKTPSTAKKSKRKKQDVSELDVEAVEMPDVSPSVKSETIKQKKLLKHSEKDNDKEDAKVIISVSSTADSPAIKEKHLSHKKKETKTGERKLKEIEKDADKENEQVISPKAPEGKKQKHKKKVENKEMIDETVKETEVKLIEIGELDIPQEKNKKKKKRSKHLLKIDSEESVANVVKSPKTDDIDSIENQEKVHKKKKSKPVRSNQQEIKTEIASTSENIVLHENESSDKTHKKKRKLKLIKPDETENDETTNTDLNKDIKQKKKLKTADDKEIVDYKIPIIKQTKLKTESKLVELTSNEESRKSKRKRKCDENDEDLSDKLKTAVSVSSKSDDETHKKIKKRYDAESFETGKPISYFPSDKLEKLSTKTATSIEIVSETKKVNEKKLKNKKNYPTFSVSTTSDSNSWISTPLETTIVPSKQNTLHSDGMLKSAKKRKLQKENEAFASKDFKNKMLYDSSRVQRMPSKDLLKKKMMKTLLNR